MNGLGRRLLAVLPWLVIALVSSGVTLTAMMPAAWITPQFAKATQGHVDLVDPSGSLWHGSATLVLAAGGGAGAGTLLPGRVSWDTAFWPLFTGRLKMRMRQTPAMPAAIEVDASARSSTVTSGEIAVPAALLAGLGAPFNTLDLQGAVQLAWTPWRLLGARAYGQLVVTLTDMSSRVSPVKPLGSYRVALQSQGDSSTIDLSTLSGSLLLSGHGTISANASAFHGQASATGEARDNLAGLLNLLGRPSGDGTVSLDYNR
ncbi:general secretion pathway protein GspN [Trinickia dabaoshanensis]|uniref:Type II secretion system protein N n=1 Tax=Trinickia dabaoshanensis TaxID=564714 RepID=A0A2N7W003_9BURK|nr:type II secretion system protein N [Trinickia dabaoshanensis]PMS22701.1 general secretion pathway protein GspN [Trinickia dabaoshanensis]